MKKVYTIVTVIFLLASVGLIVGLSRKSTPLSKAYTLRSRVQSFDASSNVVGGYDEVRYVSRNGNWRDVKTMADGSEQVLVGDYNRQSVFAVRKNKLNFVSEYHGAPNYSREALAAKGTETTKLLGYEVFIMRSGAFTGYIAPELNWETLKVEIQQPDGSKLVIEPISIEMGEPGANALGYPENLPINREFFDSRHDSQPAH